MITIARAISIVAITLVAFGVQAQAPAPKGPPPLPDGKGKQLVEGLCAACHATNLISNSSGYTREHWKELIGYMIDLSNSKRLRTKSSTISPRISRRTPSARRNSCRAIFEVTFKEWVMPQLGQRTRDPIQAADGTIWYAGQFGNLIGRLDPKTGAAKEYDAAAQLDAAYRAARSQGPARGSPATRTARSAGSIPRPARRPSTRCPTPKRSTCTRSPSTRKASCTSPSSGPT